MASVSKSRKKTTEEHKPAKVLMASSVRLGATSPNLDNDYDLVVWDQPLFDGIGSRSSVLFSALKVGGTLKVPIEYNDAIGGLIRVVFGAEDNRDEEHVYYRKSEGDDRRSGGDL